MNIFTNKLQPGKLADWKVDCWQFEVLELAAKFEEYDQVQTLKRKINNF